MKTNLRPLTLAVALCASLFTATAADKPTHLAGPKGGRILDKTTPHAEFVIQKDRSVKMSGPDKLVRKLTFTGSTGVGRILMRQSADTVKKMGLELGGNASFIVFDDADIDAAVEGAMISKYRNAGQTCVCANRLYVQSGVYEAFAEKLARKVAVLKVGDGFGAGVTTGPLIDAAALAKVESHVDEPTSRRLGDSTHS